jgi:uncharacterized membrane protein YjgN (DUF898 family)
MAQTQCPTCGLVQPFGGVCASCGTPLHDPALLSSAMPSPPLQASVTTPAPESGLPWEHAGGSIAAETYPIAFHGRGGELFGIFIVNLCLTLVTLGIYRFWARVRVLRYLWSQTEFAGDRFAYHGTGKELWQGWLKAGLIFGLPFFFLTHVGDFLEENLPVQLGVVLLAYGLVLIFIPVAMVNTRRYRLSRTSWRGIRFSFRGRVSDFIKLYFSGMLLSVLTLGLYTPIFATRRQAFMVSHAYVGTQVWRFDGRGQELFGSFVRAVLLFPVTLGLSWFWYIAARKRYFWNHTALEAARFHCTVTGGQLLLLTVSNLLLLLCTLGFAWPWVSIRNVRFILRYLTFAGPVDVASIRQDVQPASATGEGLLSFLNFLDTGLDFG